MIEILDTTLRDGAQASGIEFSEHDKLAAIAALQELGVDFIEAGNPFADARDARVLQKAAGAEITAFGSTRRKGVSAKDDLNLAALARCPAPNVSVFGKSWDFQVDRVLNASLEENLDMIRQSVGFLKSRGKNVLFDAEHFFDGFAANPDYALACLEAAAKAGASRLILCDTNGGTMPEDIYAATKKAVESFPDRIIGIHAHNDCGLAAACSIAAVGAGAEHIQGTLLGFGERCGNANLSSVIPLLTLKYGLEVLKKDKLPLLTKTCDVIAECANIAVPADLPFVGAAAFSHKAGMHADGVIKAGAFEHVPPETVGNARRFIMSGLAGKNMLFQKLKRDFPYLKASDRRVGDVLAAVKENADGYGFEGADGSFFIVAKRIIEGYEPFFELLSYKVTTEQPRSAPDTSTAVIKVRVGDKRKTASADGDGPVHALDKALRLALSDFYPAIAAISLYDYKVRVINSDGATAAKVRVSITTGDGKESWTTAGVSADIIQASFFALSDAIDYKLLKSGAVNEN